MRAELILYLANQRCCLVEIEFKRKKPANFCHKFQLSRKSREFRTIVIPNLNFDCLWMVFLVEFWKFERYFEIEVGAVAFFFHLPGLKVRKVLTC